MSLNSEINKNRPGYKKTELGWIPEEWDIIKLEECFVLASGNAKDYKVHSSYNDDMKYPVYGGNGIMGYTDKTPDICKRIIIGRVGEKCGCVHVVDGPHLVTDNALYTKNWLKDCSIEYMYFLLNNYNLSKLRNKGGQPLISQKPIYSVKVLAPSLSEQKKIAEILSCWDKAIEKTENLINAKIQMKKALMQQLFFGRKRFSSFGQPSRHTKSLPEGWQFLKAGKIFSYRSTKNHGSEPVLSVTQDQGVVLRDSLERKIHMSTENTDTYKLVKRGDYVISLRSFQGGLEYSDVRGVVSPAYQIIYPVIPIDSQFYKHYFKSTYFIKRLATAIIGIREGKQISSSDFASIKLHYPPVKEQKVIGCILNTCVREIKSLSQQLELFRKQKRGLMQKLLTGEIRVK